MAANKVPGVRAACCNDLYVAANSREHNHANVLTLGSMVIGPGYMKKIVDLWLNTVPAPGRHANRVEKISRIEHIYKKA
jgi:ribose 5-phosphate isomerase B